MSAAKRRDLLEAMAYSEHSTNAERLKAMELLGAEGDNDTGPWTRIVADIEAMDDAALSAELAAFFNPGHIEQPKPIKIQPSEEQVKQSARRMIKQWSKGLRPELDPEDTPGDPSARTSGSQESAQAEPEPRVEPEPVDPLSYLSAEEIRRLGGKAAMEVGESRHRVRLWREQQALMAVVEDRPPMPRTGPDEQQVDPAAWARWGRGHDAWPDDD